jgi:hypothetical protein
MAIIGLVLNNKIISVNSLPWVHVENYQRRSLAPVRYAARAVRIKLFFRESSKIL